MNLEEYEQMYELESSHWYFVGKARMIRRVLSRLSLSPGCRLLDVGCGTGSILDMLSQFGDATGIDCSPVALDFCRKRELKRVQLGDVSGRLPFDDDSFDVVCAFDILEHMNDDHKLLCEMKRVCKPRGHCVVTVPALQVLWSEHDEALHHKRRYTKRQIRRLVQFAGMRIRKLTYTNALVFPLAITYRLAKRLRRSRSRQPRSEFFVKVPHLINNAMLGVFTLEGALLSHINAPIGVSILCVCEKASA